MAAAVEFRTYKPDNSRDDLVRRIQEAPVEHAQAILSAYELLEQLHSKGVLDLLNGLLSAGDTVIDHVVDVASSKQAVTGLRLVLLLSNLLNSIDADRVHEILSGTSQPSSSPLAIAKLAASADSRRGMAVALALLNVFGAALKNEASPKKD